MTPHEVPVPMRRVALLLLLAACALPAASAQLVPVVEPTLSLYVEDPGASLFPGMNETLEVHVIYNLAAGAHPEPSPTPDRPENVTPTRITLAVKQMPSWVSSAQLVPEVLEVEMDSRVATGIQNRHELVAALVIEMAPDAPAHLKEDIVLTAIAEPNGNIAGASAESGAAPVKVQPVAKLNVTAADALILQGGRWAEVPFAIRNEGNDDVVAKLNVTLRPESSQVEFPTTLELKRGETKVVDVRLRTPWNAAEFGDLELEATPIVDGQEAQAATASVAITGQSAVPLTGALPLAALVVAVAFLTPRR